jgi:hypothetical protein
LGTPFQQGFGHEFNSSWRHWFDELFHNPIPESMSPIATSKIFSSCFKIFCCFFIIIFDYLLLKTDVIQQLHQQMNQIEQGLVSLGELIYRNR